MLKRSILYAAAGAAALAIGLPATAAAEVQKKPPARSAPTVRTNTQVNVNRAPQIKNTVRTTTSTNQYRKLSGTGTGGGGGGGSGGGSGTGSGGPKFHKGTGPGNNAQVGPNKLNVAPNKLNVAPNTLHVTPALHAAPNLKLGPGKVNPAVVRQVNFPVVRLANNRFAPMWKSHKIWWNGHWKVFVPFTAIGVVLIGGTYFYPDAYVGFARPYCEGLTPDGCQLNWQQVNFEDGGSDWQCVQYCPRPNAMPPPQAAALVMPPPVAQGSCEVTIYSEPSFAGTGVTTSEEQPALSQSGWQNQIASIEVKSGTWDFFSDENFAGNTMRLAPGPYQDLGPEWDKKIGSFMCIQGGS